MAEEVTYIDDLLAQIHYLKISYGNYLNLKKTLSAIHPQKTEETYEEYLTRLAANLDDQKIEFINATVNEFSKAASFVMFEVESLKEGLDQKAVKDLTKAYEKIELNARPEIKDAKQFVQAANDIKVKMMKIISQLQSQENLKEYSQTQE